MDYRYAYLIGNLILLLAWLFFFLKRKDLRREMITMSLIIAPLGPLSEFWYLKDYWRPETFTGWKIGFEDLMFAFSIGGIGAVIYEELLSKKFGQRHLRKHNWFFGLFTLIILISMFLFTKFLKINSIYASSLGFLIFAIIVMFKRKDLIIDSVLSGVFVGLLIFIIYLIYLYLFPEVIERWWMLENISGILILGIPIEEILWAVTWGMTCGPMYEFIIGLKLVRT